MTDVVRRHNAHRELADFRSRSKRAIAICDPPSKCNGDRSHRRLYQGKSRMLQEKTCLRP
jgi:hypothetical protein